MVEQPKFEVVAIGPCQYRKLVLTDNCPVAKKQGAIEEEQQEEEEEERCDITLEYEGSEYVTRKEVLPVYLKFLIGKGGRTKQRLELDSGASIFIPDRGSKDQRVTIKSSSKYAVYSALAQIELLLEKEEEKVDYTHYLAIPLPLKTFTAFKADVLEQGYPTFGPRLFQGAEKIHFTICMLRLHTEAQKESLETIMKDMQVQLQQEALAAHCVGLHYMNDDPKAVNVLFTTDTNADLLRKLNTLLDRFYAMLKNKDLLSSNSLHKQRLLSTQGSADIKLHATLLNSKWWPDGGTMDVRDCIQKFQDYDFGEIPLESIILVEMRND